VRSHIRYDVRLVESLTCDMHQEIVGCRPEFVWRYVASPSTWAQWLPSSVRTFPVYDEEDTSTKVQVRDQEEGGGELVDNASTSAQSLRYPVALRGQRLVEVMHDAVLRACPHAMIARAAGLFIRQAHAHAF